jgi:hypothetical protein
MNPVLLVHALMAAFLILFRHNMDEGIFFKGVSRTISSDATQANHTYALPIHRPDVVVSGSPLESDFNGAGE